MLANSIDGSGSEQNPWNNYRRSSLCIILVTHQGTKYASDMEKQFLKMKLPERYNEHNIGIRVLHTDKSMKAKDVTKLLQNNNVGKEVVAKWFNRSPYSGKMNMNLIHERGGYNATMTDAERADMTVRGRALLQEEGVDLIQNTFVLVCDMHYQKRDDAGLFAAMGMALLSGGLRAVGKANNINMTATTQLLDQATVQAADLSGFSVIMDAHLLQLEWTPEDLGRFYNKYWVDETTPAAEAMEHKRAFDNDADQFKLNYLGHYKSRSTKIEGQSSQDFDKLILSVTEKTVNKSIKELALMFPQFKPKTPLVHAADGSLVAYVGTKEDVTNKTKFDVIEAVKKNGEIKYNTVGRLKVVPGKVWNNTDIRMDEISDLSTIEGTRLYSRNSEKYSDQPYMLIESGKSRLGGMKKFTFDIGTRFGFLSVPKEQIEESMKKHHISSNSYNASAKELDGFIVNVLDLGVSWNISKAISWNILHGKLGLGTFMDLGVGTGLTYRFVTLGKKKNVSFFVKPTVGFGYFLPQSDIEYSYTEQHSKSVKYTEQVYSPYTKKWRTVTKYRTETYTTYNTEKVRVEEFTYLDWGVQLGVNYKKFYFSLGYGANDFKGLHTGFHL